LPGAAGRKIIWQFSLILLFFVYEDFLFSVETWRATSLRRAEEGLKARKSLAQGNAL
jgi:hypothetical protein